MALLNVDGVDLPAPTKFKPPNFDLDSDDSNRNELGYFQRDRVRADVFKLELAWEQLSSAELALVKSALSPAEFQVTFPTEVGPVTKKMYAGDRNVDMKSYDSDWTKIKWSISVNLTEY